MTEIKVGDKVYSFKSREYDNEALAKYRGIAALSEIDGVLPMPPAQAITALEKVFEGSLIPWGLSQWDVKFRAQIADPSSIYHRAVASAADFPITSESARVFEYLNGQVQDLGSIDAIMEPERMPEWWGKVTLLGHAYGMVHQKVEFEKVAFGEGEMTDEMRVFTLELAKYMGEVGGLIDGLDRAQLLWFLRFDSLVEQISDCEIAKKGEVRFRKRRHKYPIDMYEIMENAYSDGMNAWRMELMFSHVTFPIEVAWKRMQFDWAGSEMISAINLLPSLQAEKTRLKIIDEIGDNLEAKDGLRLQPGLLSAEGMLTFIRGDILRNRSPFVMPERFFEDIPDPNLEEEFSNFSIPRRLVPVSAMSLIRELLMHSEREEFMDFLRRVQIQAFKRSGGASFNSDEWLLRLALFSDSSQGEMGQIVANLVDDNSFPHEPFREVLLDRRSGKIALMDNGQIRVHNGVLAHARTIYVSEFVAPLAEGIVRVQPEVSPTQVAPVQVKPAKEIRKPKEKSLLKQPNRPLTPIQQVLADGITDKSNYDSRVKVVLKEGSSLDDIADGISAVDMVIAGKVFEALGTQGIHRIEALNARSSDGKTLYKVRINGKDSGMRAICTHIGNGVYEAQTLSYRGKVYRDLFSD